MSDQILAKGIKIAVIGGMTAFIDKYPILETVLKKSKCPIDDWDFFMTVAGVGTYLLTANVSEKNYKEMEKQLFELDKQMPKGLENLFEFLKNPKTTDTDLKIKIGFWVLWNIMGKPPTHEESEELAPAIGKYLELLVS